MKALSWDDFRGEARQNPARIALADGTDPRVVEAAALAPAAHQKSREGPNMEKIFAYSPPASIPQIRPDKDRLIEQLLSLTKFKSLSPERSGGALKDPLILAVLCCAKDWRTDLSAARQEVRQTRSKRFFLSSDWLPKRQRCSVFSLSKIEASDNNSFGSGRGLAP